MLEAVAVKFEIFVIVIRIKEEVVLFGNDIIRIDAPLRQSPFKRFLDLHTMPVIKLEVASVFVAKIG